MSTATSSARTTRSLQMSHRPVPRRTSSSFLSAFSSTAGSSSSSSSIPAVPPPPPPSAYYPSTSPAYSTAGREGILGRPSGTTGNDEVGDSGSVFSDVTHSTSLGGVGSATDRSYAGSVASGIAGGASNGVTWTTRAVLTDMLSKRLGTWDALKRAHQGTLYWSNTIHLPIPAIQASIDPAVLRSRPYAFSLLGMSLAPLLEIRSLSDVVLYTNRTLDQFDAASVHVTGGPAVNKGGTMKGIFKGGTKSGKRPSIGNGGQGGDLLSIGGSGDLSADFLMVYNQPFPPDYFQTLTTFFDILIELYSKLAGFLAAPQAGQPGCRSQLGSLPTPLHRMLEQTFSSTNSPATSTPHAQSSTPRSAAIDGGSSSTRRYSLSTPTAPQEALGHVKGEGSTSSGHGRPMSGWETPSTVGVQSPPLTLSGSAFGASSLRGSLSGGEPVRQDVIDGLVRLDSRIRKVTNVVMKELEVLARREIKEETAHLETLLSVLSTTDEDVFALPSGLPAASLWALGTSGAERAIQRYTQA